MSNEHENKPEVPSGARVLEVGETINDGDLHWQPSVSKWMSVTPQGDEKVEASQHGFYCRKDGD